MSRHATKKKPAQPIVPAESKIVVPKTDDEKEFLEKITLRKRLRDPAPVATEVTIQQLEQNPVNASEEDRKPPTVSAEQLQQFVEALHVEENWEAILNAEKFRAVVAEMSVSADPASTSDIESLWVADRLLRELREVVQDQLRKRIWPNKERKGSVSVRPAIDHEVYYKLVGKCDGSTADIRMLQPHEIKILFGVETQEIKPKKKATSFTEALQNKDQVARAR